MIKKRIFPVVLAFFLMGSYLFCKNEPSRFNLMVHSGVSFHVYPVAGYKPAVNVGVGLGYKLSPMFSLVFNFSYYRFIRKEKYLRYLWLGGDTYIEITPIYIGDMTHEFFDFTLNLNIKPLKSRLTPYFILGAGATYRRYFNSFTFIISQGRKIYASKTIFYLVNAGIGLGYRISRRIDIFLESTYAYCFFKMRKRNTGIIPVKIGLSWRF